MEKGLITIGAGIAIGFAAGLGGLGIGQVAASALASIAKQPEMAGRIQGLMMTAIVFIEACIIYALVMSLLFIFVV